MDLILWRHADAEEGRDDLKRRLTARGEKQAERVGRWLNGRLPADARILVSPAVRAQQTAKALDREFETVEAIAPGASGAAVLEAAQWPRGEGVVMLVGHQPSLGLAAALALTGKTSGWRMRKSGVWWIRTGEPGEPPLVVAVVTPDLL